MKSYFITYELEDSRGDYSLISEKIKSFSKWAKPMDRVWIIQTTKKASEIRDILKESIDNRGKILVMNLDDNSWGSYAVSKKVTEWMKDNI